MTVSVYTASIEIRITRVVRIFFCEIVCLLFEMVSVCADFIYDREVERMKSSFSRKRVRILPYTLVFIAGLAVGMYVQPMLHRLIQDEIHELKRTYAVMALNQTGIAE